MLPQRTGAAERAEHSFAGARNGNGMTAETGDRPGTEVDREVVTVKPPGTALGSGGGLMIATLPRATNSARKAPAL